MICEYWNDKQFEEASKTNDADINDLLEKVRKIDDRLVIIGYLLGFLNGYHGKINNR